jgi:hypothetical protein
MVIINFPCCADKQFLSLIDKFLTLVDLILIS